MKNQTYHFDVKFGEKGQLDPDTNSKLHEPCDSPAWVVWLVWGFIMLLMGYLVYKNIILPRLQEDEKHASSLVDAVKEAVKARAQASKDESAANEAAIGDEKLRQKAANTAAASKLRAEYLEKKADDVRERTGRSKRVLRLLYNFCTAEQEQDETVDEKRDYAKLDRLWKGKVPVIRRQRQHSTPTPTPTPTPTVTVTLALAQSTRRQT